jgi:hypothetical protein
MPLLVLFGLLGAPATPPDEGQWLPQQFLEFDWDELKRRGLELSRDEFWHPERGGLLSAAVQIGGCSAAFCSPDGLVATNHHCGFAAIEQNSTVERNLLRDGFAARGRDEELPARGMVVYVMKRMEDVTDRMHAAIAKAGSDAERVLLMEEEIRRIVAETEAREPATSCSVASFLNGKSYHLHVRTRIEDVRLVYAPPRSVGEVGGEDDNWLWPRHTGDFAFFRAYVGPDGNPRPHHPENVPYRPRHHLPVARGHLREGDLVLVLGYPGRTERYLSSAAVAARQTRLYPLRHRALTGVLGVLEEQASRSPEASLRLSTRIKALANVQKNAQGMVFGLRRNRVEARKLEEEARFREWLEADPGRLSRHEGVLEGILDLDAEEARHLASDEVVSQILRNCALIGIMAQAALWAAEEAREPEHRDPRYSARVRDESVRMLGRLEVDEAGLDLEARLLGAILEASLRLPSIELPPSVSRLAGADGRETARMLFAGCTVTDPAVRQSLAQGVPAWTSSEDPLVRFAWELGQDLHVMRHRQRAQQGRRLVVGRRWIEAQEEWRGRSFYPDANGTLRVSLASVRAYEPADGLRSTAFTTLRGVLEKERGEDPFRSPPALLEAAGRRGSRFEDPALQGVPVCFLADGDTTGGNSGSPIVNGKGELVGLNFDRVFENVAGDFGWNPERSRNIGVDIRYVLWNLENVLPAPELLQELGF